MICPSVDGDPDVRHLGQPLQQTRSNATVQPLHAGQQRSLRRRLEVHSQGTAELLELFAAQAVVGHTVLCLEEKEEESTEKRTRSVHLKQRQLLFGDSLLPLLKRLVGVLCKRLLYSSPQLFERWPVKEKIRLIKRTKNTEHTAMGQTNFEIQQNLSRTQRSEYQRPETKHL